MYEEIFQFDHEDIFMPSFMPTWQQTNHPEFPQRIQSDFYGRNHHNPYSREFHHYESDYSAPFTDSYVPLEYNQYNHYIVNDLQNVRETPPSWEQIHDNAQYANKVEWIPHSSYSWGTHVHTLAKVEETPPSWDSSVKVKMETEENDASLKGLPSLDFGEDTDSTGSEPVQAEPVEVVESLRSKRRRSEIQSVDFLSYGLPEDFKLPVSKSPIMESLSFCAVEKWGIEVVTAEATNESSATVVFKVTNFDMYYKYSCAICSKHKPTEDVGARVKALRRWFSDFPKKKFRKNNPVFILEVKPAAAKKVYDMIQRHRSLTSVKRRRLN